MKKLLQKAFLLTCISIPVLSFSTSNIALAQFGSDTHGYVPGITGVIGTEKPQESALLDTVRNTINRILGILATVALIIIMYAGFKMLTSGGDSKGYDSGLKTLKNAALGLALIGLSWLIVSAIFWFVNLQAGDGSQLTGG